MVRLAVGNRMVTVSEYCLRPVSQHEFDKNTLDLSECASYLAGRVGETFQGAVGACTWG